LKLESGIYGESLLEKDKWIMEIKANRSMPVWLAHLLAEHKIYPVSFSKYGTEYKHLLMDQINQDSGKFEFDTSKISLGALMPA
jgi:hypothetical protein